MQYGWFLIAAVASAIPITLVKKYNLTNDIKWLIFAFILYLILIFSYIQLLKNEENLSVLYPIIKIISIFIVLAVAMFYYGETLEWKHIIGILLGTISIYLLHEK